MGIAENHTKSGFEGFDFVSRSPWTWPACFWCAGIYKTSPFLKQDFSCMTRCFVGTAGHSACCELLCLRNGNRVSETQPDKGHLASLEVPKFCAGVAEPFFNKPWRPPSCFWGPVSICFSIAQVWGVRSLCYTALTESLTSRTFLLWMAGVNCRKKRVHSHGRFLKLARSYDFRVPRPGLNKCL